MRFPYGRAPFWIMVVAVGSGVGALISHPWGGGKPPDLTFALFARIHYEAYKDAVAEFERQNGVTIQMQLVNPQALQSRLQSALLVGADVPDLVELLEGSMGFFTRGPLEDVGFLDLTDRIHAEGLYDALVQSRFSLWSSRGRIFALPHDVHPVGLAYRRDLVEALRIDPDRIETWDDFTRMGRAVTKDLDGDGIIDRYAIDLPSNGSWALTLLVLQRGGGLFDENGRVTFDSETAVDTICWYVRQVQGPDRIAFPAGWGQILSKTMIDGLVLFYICPDWRTRQFETDVPSLSGKLATMPLPAWEKGGRRTSTWGGTGLAISRRCHNPELAWKFAKFLYYDKKELGRRFSTMNIIPPLRAAWDLPELKAANPFYSGQPIGTLYAGMAPDTPPFYVTAYVEIARAKLEEAFTNAALHYEAHGDKGLQQYARDELFRCAEYVRTVSGRNAFLFPQSRRPGDSRQ